MSKIISILLAGVFSFFLFAVMTFLVNGEAQAIQSQDDVTVTFGNFDYDDIDAETRTRKNFEMPEKQEPVQEPTVSDAIAKNKAVNPVRIAKRPDIKFNSDVASGVGAGGLMENVYAGNGLSKAPSIRIEPHYPMKARHDGIEGHVTLQFDINELGETTNIKILEAKPKGYFEKESRKALRKWKYKKEAEEESVAATNQVVTLSFKMAQE